MSEKKKEIKMSSESLHAIQDHQGKIYFAERTPFGWWTVDGIPLPSYGYSDLGLVLRAYNKLAQYRHANRVLNTYLVNKFNDYVSLIKEVEND